ncbi:hypothetical protein K470DRAFT_32631 [Piedraia hortae CBS 480.64]|uniref:Uncharacterized protein n=1 Tax=Piedraia hortae CBS 480.64 TaxID=1314780 RepID=A0A6A7C2I8_9PEZI|nr:hypothetical protein K470DRAFT_32631 [Piedraia hortae CBS 480.64]
MVHRNGPVKRSLSSARTLQRHVSKLRQLPWLPYFLPFFLFTTRNAASLSMADGSLLGLLLATSFHPLAAGAFEIADVSTRPLSASFLRRRYSWTKCLESIVDDAWCTVSVKPSASVPSIASASTTESASHS